MVIEGKANESEKKRGGKESVERERVIKDGLIR